jgi:hydrogenase expression/formation protein HypD
MTLTAQDWLNKIKALPLTRRVRIMNVCGGHERSITMAGLRAALLSSIELIPGPGCPVCVCPEEDVYLAMQLALHAGVILVAFGDMLRVPVNVPKSEPRSLEQAKAAGADIRPVSSPQEAVRIAMENPERQVVFFAAGFETTTAPVAAMLLEGVPENLFVLLSGRLTWPAVAMLLDSDTPGFDALIAPGHVATVMGPEEWGFVVEKHHMPAAVAGFTPLSLLAAIYSVLRQLIEAEPKKSVRPESFDPVRPELVEGANGTQDRFVEGRTHDVPHRPWFDKLTPTGCKNLCEATNGESVQRFPEYFLDNCYPEAVRPGGNAAAQKQLQQALDVTDANWRGIGIIPASGFALNTQFAAHDARKQFTGYETEGRKRVGEMPPGCDCARVVLGKIYPNECKLFGTACTPRTPVGPCMVSDEGACRIWRASGVQVPSTKIIH